VSSSRSAELSAFRLCIYVETHISLSHKGLDVSYCEIRAVGSVGLLLPTAMTSADLGCNRLAECSISRCETHGGLCDRLTYAFCWRVLPEAVPDSLFLSEGARSPILCALGSLFR
jgi:hypothetical protein